MKRMFNTIRKRMLLYFIITAFIMSFMNFYIFSISDRFINQMDSMFISSVFLNDIEQNINNIDQNLVNFLSTKSSDNLNNYIIYTEELKEKFSNIDIDLSYQMDDLILKDISNLIVAYIEQADFAIDAKRGRNINEYINNYTRASKIRSYIQTYINKLNINSIQKNTEQYLILSNQMKYIQISTIVMMIAIIVLVVLIIIYITYKMTEPIVKLSHSAKEISKGNFETDEVIVTTDDEIRIMVQAFNDMKHSIQKYIQELKDKADTESKLMEAKMNNLEMKNLLDNAKLQALQAQINPHFLFNTLNAGVQLSMIEGAERTSDFLENMSALFRYNIQKLDKKVTLREEVNNVKAYYNLLKVRFGDLIKFEFDLDESVLDFEIPPLIIQPLVENAYIHGIGGSEIGGLIKLKIYKQQNNVKIIVSDNGKGMNEIEIDNVMKKINSYDVEPKNKSGGHTTGIGLSNVFHRLRMLYSSTEIFEIQSIKGQGTKMILTIPIG